MKQFLTILSISLLIFGELMLPAVELLSDVEIHIENSTSEKESKSEKELESLDGEFVIIVSDLACKSLYDNTGKYCVYTRQFGSELIKDVVSPPPDLV